MEGQTAQEQAVEEQTVEEQPTCGRGLAQSSVVPSALAAVAAALAENLEVHTRALDTDHPAAGRERRRYEHIAHILRGAAADLGTAAAEMASAVDLPMVDHDMSAITGTDVLDAFEHHVAAETDLRRVLDARREENEEMLRVIRAEAGSRDAG